MDNLSLPRMEGKQLLVSSMVSKLVTIDHICYNVHVFGLSFWWTWPFLVEGFSYSVT